MSGGEIAISLLTLTGMEIVLGIDNIVFISILTDQVPAAQQARVRTIGIALALVLRVGLLFAITWVMGLTAPFVTLFSHTWSGRDLILLGGGLFLVAKATKEIYSKMELAEAPEQALRTRRSVALILVQIILLDLVFSLDSVITAVGMAQAVWVMIVAMLVAVGVMLLFAGAISRFVNRHPSMKILALSFLILIGVALMAEAMHQPISKGYIYFAMAYALVVEMINLRLRKRAS